MDAQLKISEVADKINSIETGGGGNAVVVCIPDDSDDNYYNPQLYYEKSYRSTAENDSISWKNTYFTSNKNETLWFYVYELTPSSKEYFLGGMEQNIGDTDMAVKWSTQTFKFDEPKLYILEAKNYTYSS